jgi:TRAP-type C4-dicarboxylate transport system substrate-binding protein
LREQQRKIGEEIMLQLTMLRRAVLAGLMAVIAWSASAQAQQTVKMTVIAGHPPVFLWVKLVDDFFIPEIDKRLAAAGGKIKVEWVRGYGGTVVKLGGESGALKDGLAEIGFVSTIFEAPKFPLQNVTYVAPFGTDNLSLVSKIVGDMQTKIPAMNEAWTKNNLVFLGSAALDSYHLFTKFEIKSLADLKGKKINAPGPSANWIKDTGAIAVAGTLQTYYNDISTGVSDGALTFITGGGPAKLVEVAPFITKVNYGAMFAGALAMNKQVFDKLPPEARKIFLDVGAEYSVLFAKTQTETVDKTLEAMVKAGAKVRTLSAEERKQWAAVLPNVAQAWAKDLDAKGLPGSLVLKGYMEGLKAGGVELARDWSAN